MLNFEDQVRTVTFSISVIIKVQLVYQTNHKLLSLKNEVSSSLPNFDSFFQSKISDIKYFFFFSSLFFFIFIFSSFFYAFRNIFFSNKFYFPFWHLWLYFSDFLSFTFVDCIFSIHWSKLVFFFSLHWPLINIHSDFKKLLFSYKRIILSFFLSFFLT